MTIGKNHSWDERGAVCENVHSVGCVPTAAGVYVRRFAAVGMVVRWDVHLQSINDIGVHADGTQSRPQQCS